MEQLLLGILRAGHSEWAQSASPRKQSVLSVCALCSPSLQSLSYLLTFNWMGVCVVCGRHFTERVWICDSVVSWKKNNNNNKSQVLKGTHQVHILSLSACSPRAKIKPGPAKCAIQNCPTFTSNPDSIFPFSSSLQSYPPPPHTHTCRDR